MVSVRRGRVRGGTDQPRPVRDRDARHERMTGPIPELKAVPAETSGYFSSNFLAMSRR